LSVLDKIISTGKIKATYLLLQTINKKYYYETPWKQNNISDRRSPGRGAL